MIERPTDGDTTRAGGSGAWETWAPSAPASRIRAVLGVEPGERPLCPEFGWAAHAMGPLDSDAKRAVAAVLAEDALRRWVGDLAVDRIDVLESRASEFVLDVRCEGARFRLLIPRVSEPDAEAEPPTALEVREGVTKKGLRTDST